MQDLSLEMAKAVRRFEPIETEGLTLYPIQVKDIDEFTTARPAIEFMQQSLPVAMLSKPLLQAYYTLELDAAKTGQPFPIHKNKHTFQPCWVICFNFSGSERH